MKITLLNIPFGLANPPQSRINLEKNFHEGQTTPWQNLFLQMSEGMSVHFTVPCEAITYPFSNMQDITFRVARMSSRICFPKGSEIPKLSLSFITLEYIEGAYKNDFPTLLESFTGTGWSVL